MIKPTHEKIPYPAYCIQWDGRNTAEVIAHFDEACLYDTDNIMIRHSEGISTMRLGDWVRIGQNGTVKVIKPEVFAERYRAV